MRVVIIGGDAAGMSAASAAKRAARDAEVVVLEKTTDVSYGACGLPYKLPAGEDVEALKVVSAETFRAKRGIDLRLEHEVTALDPDAHTVHGVAPSGEFSLTYDKLLVATGARVFLPPIPGLEGLLGRGAHPLKTLQDGRELVAALEERAPEHVVVIGAGYIGLEATEGLRSRGARVTVVEALPSLLPFLPEPLRQLVRDEAARHGVDLREGTRVEALVRTQGGRVQVHVPGEVLEADLVVVATGVVPASDLARDAGLELGARGAIKTDAGLRTSAPDVWSAGDCADATHFITGRSTWVPLALRANRAGKLAGRAMTGVEVTAPPIMGTAAFKFFDLQIARTGLSAREAVEAGYEDPVQVVVKTGSRAHYYPGGTKLHVALLADRGSRRLLGASIVGTEAAAHRIDTAVAALAGGMTADDLYDLDLAYAPPFSPSWSPLLTAASVLAKALDKASR